MRTLRLLILTLIISGLLSCRTDSWHQDDLNALQAVAVYLDEHEPEPYANGQPTDWESVNKAILSSRVIYVGELHHRFDHHLNQLALLRTVHQTHPDVSIGVEWFQKPFQSELDLYLAGDLTETELLEQTEYFDRWGYDFRMLRPVLQYARQHRIPIIALNTDVRLTQKVSRMGLEGLSEAERAQLPRVISPPSAEELSELKTIFSYHTNMSEDHLNRFVTIQRIWDLTMSDGIVAQLSAHPEQTMLVFAAEHHLSEGRAIPAEVARQRPDWSTSVVHSRETLQEDTGRNDYLLVAKAQDLPRQGQLGVWLDTARQGARISRVKEHSAADAAGLQTGDVVTQLNESPITDSASLKIALADLPPEESISLKINRPTSAATAETMMVKVVLR